MGYYLPSGVVPSACRTPTGEKGTFVAESKWDTNHWSSSSQQTLTTLQAMASCDRGLLTSLLGSLLLCAVLVLLVGHRRQEPAVPEVTQLDNPKSFSSYITTLRRVRREVEPPAVTTPQPPLEDIGVQDVFIAVKTTSKFHRSRLDLLMDTWVSRSKEQTFIFTDDDDEELKKRTANVINTNCSSAHSRQALSCKMAVEYDKFIESGKKWFCHVDDDNYVNIRTLVKLLSAYPHTQDIYIGKPSLDRPIQATERISENKMRPVSFWFATGGAGFCISRGLALKMSPWASGGHFMSTSEKIRLPDDCTIGYIIEAVLGVKLIRSNLFHSHLENLYQVPSSEIHKQVTLSYGMFENKRNAINMRGAFSVQKDPSRFRSIHCLLYPDTPWCPQNIVY